MSRMDVKSLTILVAVLTITVAPVISNFYMYYFTHNYNYLIKVNCDPKKEICFYEECEGSPNCDQQEVNNYKKYYVKALDFDKCKHDMCQEECDKGEVKCKLIPCGESIEDLCTSFVK